MKANLIATAAMATSAVSAQSMTMTADPTLIAPDPTSSTSTYTEYYNTCTTSTEGIETATTTETYCPICEAMSMSTYPGGSLTTYTTVYKAQCPTGIEDKTYTITEPCPSAGFEDDHTPQGYAVTTVPCGCKENTPVAITTPGPAYVAAVKTLPAAAPAAPTPKSAPAGAPAAASAAAPAAAPAGAPAEAAAAPAAPGAPAEAPAEAPVAAPAGAPAGAPAEAAAAAPAAPGAPAEAPAEAPVAAPAGAPAEAPAAGAAPPYPVPGAPVNIAAAATGTGTSNAKNIKPFTGSAATTSAFPMLFVFGLVGLIAPFAFAL
ncbi:hypothetical protein OEA41_000383 [Lepraria neglecta]|uniref:Uncharacterized protein n=1 Tax=Lepraria neglecta TaxID=209136 RepID=A0AAD9ZFV5_9LECA|nr:hypothetical protein OEA41_000383 [Lepraria neglecta]